MTGASDRHEEIAGNLLAALHGHLKGSECRVYGSNLEIRVGDDFFYPDLFVRCGRERGDPYFKTDPVLIAEVLSPGTHRFDRGDKRLAYQSLPTLQDYLLLNQDEPGIDIRRRTADGWTIERLASMNSTPRLSSLGLDIEIAEIYS